MAPRSDVPIREIVYQLSPYQQDIIKQTFTNAPKTFFKFLADKGPRYAITAAIYFSAQAWTLNELHQEKLHARY